MSEQPFYDKDGEVWKRPDIRHNPDGSENVTLGFRVCTPAEGVDVGLIVTALNVAADQNPNAK